MFGFGKNIEKKRTPEWIRPKVRSERGEIERVVKEFLHREVTTENIEEIIALLESTQMTPLSEEDWRRLENTDSYERVRPGHLEDAEMITKEYNLELEKENQRDFKKTLMGFYGGKMETPTILQNQAGKLHLVSGNTRLMISRAMEIRPMVIIGKIK